jgi:hypothetical protein
MNLRPCPIDFVREVLEITAVIHHDICELLLFRHRELCIDQAACSLDRHSPGKRPLQLLVLLAPHNHEDIIFPEVSGFSEQSSLDHGHRPITVRLEPPHYSLAHQRMDGAFEAKAGCGVAEDHVRKRGPRNSTFGVERGFTEESRDGGGASTPGFIKIVDDRVGIENGNPASLENPGNRRFAGRQTPAQPDCAWFSRVVFIRGVERDFRIPNSEFRIHPAGSSNHSVW